LVGKTINEANIELGSKSFQLTEIYNNCMTKADSLVAKIVQQSPDYMDEKTIAEGSEIIVIANK
jgi:beta-galactosidase beta subunit